jgi:transcriptional regulatory protein RtcR
VYGALHDFARATLRHRGEDYLIHITTGTHVAQICLFLLTEARYLPARLLQTAAAQARTSRQPGATRSSTSTSRATTASRSASPRAARGHGRFLKSGIATRNAAFNALIEQIERWPVRSKAPMLLMGPTGAGKSQLARRIYELKKQRHQVAGRFVEVNCATLRGDAAMSTLFGHREGRLHRRAERPRRPAARGRRRPAVPRRDRRTRPRRAGDAAAAIEEKRFLPLGADREVAATSS